MNVYDYFIWYQIHKLCWVPKIFPYRNKDTLQTMQSCVIIMLIKCAYR